MRYELTLPYLNLNPQQENLLRSMPRIGRAYTDDPEDYIPVRQIDEGAHVIGSWSHPGKVTFSANSEEALETIVSLFSIPKTLFSRVQS